MALDPRYVLMQGLEQYFVDKDTGLPLANGEVWFFADNNRNSLKFVYELSGAPPNYTYSAMPNPITLSAVGTIQDANGDNVAIYYLPYSNVNPDQIELYYIAVFRQGEGPNGVPQFTREAWPNITSADNPANEGQTAPTNEISNSQFVDVLFDPTDSMVIPYTGSGTDQVEFAPGWFVEIEHTSGGSVTITRNNRTGSSSTPTNAPYTLQVQAGSNITNLSVVQRLYHNPSIWSPIVPNMAGWINAGVLLGPNTRNLRVLYRPSNYQAVANTQVLLTADNGTGNFVYASDTTQLIPGNNTDLSTVGYVDIVVQINPGGTSIISSVQIMGLTDDVAIPYEQQPVNRQEDFLSHYYKPLLAYKPIPSYLVGWDFPLNPSQFYANGVRAAQAIGANKSEYKWDQTLVFQSTDSGVGTQRGAMGELQLTAALTTQMAVIQYLDATQARKLLSDRMAVHVRGSATSGAPISGVVSLWWTDEANLPDANAGTNNSIVLTLDADGKPATQNGTWTEVPRSNLGNASFTLLDAGENTFDGVSFSGWEMTDKTDIETATFFAIVVGFESITAGGIVNIQSVSLCQGDIATSPAPQTPQEVVIDCNRYYWKTFNLNTTPAENVGESTGEYRFTASATTPTDSNTASIFFPAPMRVTPALTFYNPVAANAFARCFTNNTDCTTTASDVNSSLTATSFNFHLIGTLTVGFRMGVHITADARLGIVN